MEITAWAQKDYQKSLPVNTVHCAIDACRLALSCKDQTIFVHDSETLLYWTQAQLKWTEAKWKSVLWSDKLKWEIHSTVAKVTSFESVSAIKF